MFAFPGMLVPAAEKAGMKVPKDPDKFNNEEYPHFAVYCAMQLGSAMPYAGVHWDNAKVIADVPEDKIRKLTAQDLFDLGFQVGHPIP